MYLEKNTKRAIERKKAETWGAECLEINQLLIRTVKKEKFSNMQNLLSMENWRIQI